MESFWRNNRSKWNAFDDDRQEWRIHLRPPRIFPSSDMRGRDVRRYCYIRRFDLASRWSQWRPWLLERTNILHEPTATDRRRHRFRQQRNRRDSRTRSIQLGYVFGQNDARGWIA